MKLPRPRIADYLWMFVVLSLAIPLTRYASEYPAAVEKANQAEYARRATAARHAKTVARLTGDLAALHDEFAAAPLANDSHEQTIKRIRGWSRNIRLCAGELRETYRQLRRAASGESPLWPLLPPGGSVRLDQTVIALDTAGLDAEVEAAHERIRSAEAVLKDWNRLDHLVLPPTTRR